MGAAGRRRSLWYDRRRCIVPITLNGESREIDVPVSVSELLQRLDIDARRVAVELNLTVVKKALYDSSIVKDGDEVEIVNFVGGG
jgi:thiamine biosynthesis protein ThiS